MKRARSSSKFLLVALAAATVMVSLANAEIPAGYAGVPFPKGSAPRELNGRINFSEYDLGAKNVTWYADDAWGHAPYREKYGDSTGPAFFCTNDNSSDRDTFYAASVVFPNGVRYPDPVDTSVQDCYIGASHSNSWTKWTVHVSKAGKYWISSIWSAMEEPAHYRVMFLNGKDTVSTPLDSFKQEASYHAWRKYSDFASVQLDTGVQVLFFQNGSNHLNQDFLYFAADSGQFPTGISQPASKVTRAGTFDLSINRETVRFTLPDAGKTKIAVFDCLGREIVPVLNKTLSAGSHSAHLNTASLRKGIYFVRLEHNNVAN
ncbi:MAG TPA: T9SS type A sorting domain-containing protein, partial [Chitinivibrionales bacterium]|nr:T9SS type A sorting domain-containing protein [Chitinivibrionales bacterium]